MVIIKCNFNARGETLQALWEDFCTMASKGVIVLPCFCELVNEVPADSEVVVIKSKEE